MADQRSNDESPASARPESDGARRAVTDLIAGDLDACEAWCIDVAGSDPSAAAAIRSSDERTAVAASAIIAYLRGDFAFVLRLGADAEPSALSALPAVALTQLAIGEHEAARRAIEQLGAASPAPAHAVVMASLVEDRQPVGADAAALLALGSVGDPVTGDAPGVELLEAEVAAGRRLSAAVPVSLERALGVELARLGRLDEAVDVLASAEEHWREQRAYTEVVEVLVQQAEINAVLGRRDRAQLQASEAYALAERLGMLGAKARALGLHHTSTPDGMDLGSPEERIVLMSDVVGSTRVSTTDGDEAYYDLVMTHHNIVRRALADHGGVEFSEGGDSLLAWFEASEDALDCALEVLRKVTAEARSGGGLRVRLSLAGGEPFFRDGRPYGTVVNLAARLIVEAEPGQVVVDEATLLRMGPAVRGFTTRTIELDDFGAGAIGFLSP
jgi:class 3 adenylate cyclase